MVGNITVGGTGKTPLIIWMAQYLQQRGFNPGVISRGYGGQAKTWPQVVTANSDCKMVGDEPIVIARQVSCPIAVGPSRVEDAQLLITDFKCDIILSDDGLQHYHLGRSIEIAVIDGERGLGNGACLPAGPLREPRCRLDQVDAVIVNGSGLWEPDHHERHYKEHIVFYVHMCCCRIVFSALDYICWYRVPVYMFSLL